MTHILPNELYYVWYFTIQPHLQQWLWLAVPLLAFAVSILVAKGIYVVYMLYVDGRLIGAYSSKTEADIACMQEQKENKGADMYMIAVNGHIQQHILADEDEEEVEITG